MIESIYLPRPAEIVGIVEETSDTKSFELRLRDGKRIDFIPGQYLMISVMGEGEFPVSFLTAPTEKKLAVCVKRMGKVTTALHRLEPGEMVWIRGPYGNGFPTEDWRDKKLWLIGGGIGLPPLRTLLYYVLDRGTCKGVNLVYGARSRADLIREQELVGLRERNVRVELSIDNPEEGWSEFVGFVPSNLTRISPSPNESIAVTCGPPIMIKVTIENLLELGFKPDQIFTTLEMRMKCGVGKCGRCNIGDKYACRDGPVFSHEMLKKLPPEY